MSYKKKNNNIFILAYKLKINKRSALSTQFCMICTYIHMYVCISSVNKQNTFSQIAQCFKIIIFRLIGFGSFLVIGSIDFRQIGPKIRCLVLKSRIQYSVYFSNPGTYIYTYINFIITQKKKEENTLRRYAINKKVA